jgi:hypothetical protein
MGSKEGVAWLVVVCCCSDQYVMIWLTRAALVASDCMRVPIVTTCVTCFAGARHSIRQWQLRGVFILEAPLGFLSARQTMSCDSV